MDLRSIPCTVDRSKEVLVDCEVLAKIHCKRVLVYRAREWKYNKVVP